MIALLKGTDFDPAEIDTDLHKRVADAIQDGYIKRFDMRVNSRDGDQDLTMTTFGCVEWESELYRGVMRARCYPWNMPKHRFHKMNPQVIPCYPWLCTLILGYPGISLSDVPAPGLLHDSPALPVQPGGSL